MADKAMDVYLNDHLAGAMLGSDLAKQIRARAEGTPLGEIMDSVAPQIEEDRQTLMALMKRMGTSKNPIKRAVGWVTEKASRVKLKGLTAGDPELGIFMSVETLALGVRGKLGLWKALQQVADRYPAIRPAELDQLIGRAESQYSLLEHERLSAGAQALSPARVNA
jgi:hypothetical protein